MIENDQMGPIQIVSVDQVALETPWKDGVVFEERIKLQNVTDQPVYTLSIVWLGEDSDGRSTQVAYRNTRERGIPHENRE